MREWFITLSTGELRRWIRQMDSPMARFFNDDEQTKNVETAKQVLAERTRG